MQCTASDCAMLILARGSPHAQMPEWQTFTSLAFQHPCVAGPSSIDTEAQTTVLCASKRSAPLRCAARPRRSSTSGEAVSTHGSSALHGSAHDGTFMHGCAHDIGYPDNTSCDWLDCTCPPPICSTALRMQLCRQWQLSLPQKNWTLSEML